MKLVLVTLSLQNVSGKRMKYPAIYNAAEVELNKKGPIIYEGAFSRHETTEKILLYLDDVVADKYIGDAQGLCIEKTVAEADSWLATNIQESDKPDESVTDQARLIAITAKAQAGITLSTDDLAALDPDNATPGISKKKTTVAEFYGI